jgi:hypothetical protein
MKSLRLSNGKRHYAARPENAAVSARFRENRHSPTIDQHIGQ